MTLDVALTPSEDGSATVAVGGEVDITTAPQLRDALAAAVEAYPRVLLDLTAVTYLDSAGVRALYGFVGLPVEVAVDGEGLLPRVLAITGLDRQLVVHTR